MIRERSRTNGMQARSQSDRAELARSDELAPLPDWSQLGRHILAEALRRAMARLEARQTATTAEIETHAKELS